MPFSLPFSATVSVGLVIWADTRGTPAYRAVNRDLPMGLGEIESAQRYSA